MATYTDNILLTLREPTDPVEVESFNRDNKLLDALLAPVAEDYSVLSSAARINSYNLMKAIRAAYYSGIETPEKTAMFFGDFDTAADSTSANALHCPEKYGYLFSAYGGSSYACGAAGDVSNTLGKTECSFNFEAPVSGYIVSLEADLKAASSGVNCYLSQCYFGDTYKHNVKVGAMSTVRGIQTLTFSTPIPIHKGDILTGALVSGTMEGTGYLYSAALGVPYIKFNIVPAMESGWVQTGLSPLGDMGHSEARVYVQCLKDSNGVITAALVDENGSETKLTQVSARTTVTKDNIPCTELGFTAPYVKDSAALRINADANGGYADIYNYAVTML